MGSESNNCSRIPLSEIDKAKPGLFYDTDHLTLLGKFTNEMAAYRARNEWKNTLHSYFLLEPERDFDMEVISSIKDNRFALSCTFTSACGRYAFWRLINRQAPEAEQKLGGLGERPNRPAPRNRTEIITDRIELEIKAAEDNRGLIERLLGLFSK